MTESMGAFRFSGRSLFCGREEIAAPEIVDGAGDQAGDDDEGISENHGHGGRGWWVEIYDCWILNEVDEGQRVTGSDFLAVTSSFFICWFASPYALAVPILFSDV